MADGGGVAEATGLSITNVYTSMAQTARNNVPNKPTAIMGPSLRLRFVGVALAG